MDITNKDMNDIRNQLGTLRKACLALTALALVGPALTFGLLSKARATSQGVLRAERLEIVEPDGQLAFVMANSQRPGAVHMNGQRVFVDGDQRRKGSPSLIFFDGKGDEVGGMLMGTGTQEEDGYLASRQLTLDAYKQDQTVVLRHLQSTKGTFAGLYVSDRPNVPLTDGLKALGLQPGVASFKDFRAAIANPTPSQNEALNKSFGGPQRVFVGSELGEAKLELADGEGNPRFVVSVPERGPVSLKVLDEKGQEQGLSSLLSPKEKAR